MTKGKKQIEVVNDFYDCLLNKSGKELADIVTEDVIFNGPFFKANGAKDFLEGMERWAQVKKTYNIIKQFIDGNDICSVYSVNAVAPTGLTVRWDAVDWIKVRDGKIASITLYFDPREWAKAIGK